MGTITQTVLIVVASLTLVSFIIVLFCMRLARKVLRPISKRKPLSAWPDQYGMPYEKITIETEDKVLLKGWFIPSQQPSNKTIILMHDWGMNRSDILKNTYFLREIGFNLCYFDFRALGESSGKNSSIGYLELKDIKAVISFLKENRPQYCEKIGLYGLSMGGMVAIYETARNLDVNCVVAEGAYCSVRRMIAKWAWRHHKIPYLPFVPIVLHYVHKYLGINPERYSPRYNISKIAPRPVFIIHGQYDNIVPIAQVKKLFERASAIKELWIVPKAKHNKCAEIGGYEYKQRLADFYRQYL